MFHKFGENMALTPASIQSAESVLCNDEINRRFEKFAAELKKIAPKAKDFLYFSTHMMTAAEAAIYNEDGSIKTGSDGNPITVIWEPKGESIKWVCSDPNIHPYKNNNGDIFPESELVKAHKMWIGKPLCLDHKSASVDAIRGIILDTYYDYKSKKVIALCALDAVNYPDLARKVSTGYANSVSMGTVVKKAICYNCGQVARSERDFCTHMRNKTSPEINTELDPIELSLVTNPADVSAKIRTVFASSQAIRNKTYSSDIKEKIAQVQQSLNEISGDLSELNDISKEEQLSNSENNRIINADFNALFTELKLLKSSMEKTLEELNKKQQEDIMTDSINKKSYFQGGGGVNEPAPGKVKYPKDSQNEDLREDGDKQMLQTKPYGGEGDEKVKAEVRPVGDKAARRKEALENAKKNLSKQSYWNGGGGVNEPTPGKVKYPADPMAEKIREKEDKQMTGKKPFPGVGDVEGLYGDDLSVKEKLSRASLTARFIRKANVDGTDDLGNSGWQIFAKDDAGQKLIFTASVNDISGGQVDQLYDMIATKEFATTMLEKIREVGLEKAASLYKKAQAVNPSVSGPMPEAAPTQMPEAASAEPALGEESQDVGGEGDPNEQALNLATQLRDNSAELLEVVRKITGSQAEMGKLEKDINALPQATASTLIPAAEMRKKLERMIISAAKKSLAELKSHYTELRMISDMADSATVKNASVYSMIKQAFNEANAANTNAEGILRSYAKYENGVENIAARVKVALEELEEEDLITEEAPITEETPTFMFGDEDADQLTETERDPFKEEWEEDEDEDLLSDDSLVSSDMLSAKDNMCSNDESYVEDGMDINDVDGQVVEMPKDKPLPPDAKPISPEDMKKLQEGQNVPGPSLFPTTASMDLTTKAGRAAYRAKLAEHITDLQDASKIKFNPVLDEADSLANGQTQLDVKPSDQLGLVETPAEVNKRMLEVAKAPPSTKVKKEAERLNTMIVSGAVKKEDLDRLVSEGLDSDVVKYWRDFYGQAEGGSEFAKLLTSASEKAKMQEEMEVYKVKLARSYELANEMARRGLISNERTAISRQVEESMKWNDEAFDSFKRVIANRPVSPVKTAGVIPQVGIRENESYSTQDDLQSELDLAFSTRKY